ncbi:hypothetical protein [Mucilaginibacter mallensis]|nr:hypothetical protein [Mucilaginibacter mallensis]
MKNIFRFSSIILVRNIGCKKEDSTQTIGLGAFDNTGKSTMELDDFAN